MRKFRFNKLVRDKIISQIEANGGKVVYRKLNQAELIDQLKIKLAEEAKELQAASSDELRSELADVSEIISALLDLLEVGPAALAAERERKNTKNGAFELGHFIDYVELADDPTNPWLKYYLDHPEQYPEIRD